MNSDLAGRIRNTALATRNGLLPLFEAVVNAVEAIDERQSNDGRIDIEILRRPSLTLTEASEDGTLLPDIQSFVISDNGIGFTEENFSSFDTLDSPQKEERGGKGVGRLVWLVAFEHAVLDSTYEENGRWWHRTFEFRKTAQGVEHHHLNPDGVSKERRTVVRLVNFSDRYREEAPKTALAIAKRIIEHCLVRYMLDTMPRVVLHDSNGTAIDLTDLYTAEFKRSSDTATFTVKGQSFKIIHMILRASSEAENAIHYCANNRVVKSQNLGSAIAHIDGDLRHEDEDVRYAACVTGALLDERVTAQRTDFDLDHTGELAFTDSVVTWEEIQDAALAAVKEFLEPHLKDARERSIERIRQYVEEEEPRYRPLLRHKSGDLETIPTTLSDQKLEIELHKRLMEWRHEAKVAVDRQMAKVPDSTSDFLRFKEEAVRALGDLQEIAKADLVDYVIHRRAVLDFFEKLLGLMSTGKFEREDTLHGLFFPMRTTSDEISYDDHNLWVIDERLAFHHYLASDIPLEDQDDSPVEVDSSLRPDLLIFNRHLAFASADIRPFSSIVILEFKRPQRNDYSEGKNPVTQVYGYVRELRAGKARNRDGSPVDAVEPTVPCYCHIIATLNPTLKQQLDDMGFVPGPDGQSFFTFNAKLNTFVEVTTYNRVLQDAVKRNKAFFAKLGLQTGLKRI